MFEFLTYFIIFLFVIFGFLFLNFYRNSLFANLEINFYYYAFFWKLPYITQYEIEFQKLNKFEIVFLISCFFERKSCFIEKIIKKHNINVKEMNKKHNFINGFMMACSYNKNLNVIKNLANISTVYSENDFSFWFCFLYNPNYKIMIYLIEEVRINFKNRNYNIFEFNTKNFNFLKSSNYIVYTVKSTGFFPNYKNQYKIINLLQHLNYKI